jgi:hypothetical protein
LINFRSHESKLSTNLLSCLTSILGLKTGEPELEIEAESEMKLVGVPVHGPTSEEDELTEAPVVLLPVALVSVKILLVAVHLLLRVNVLE